MDIDALFRQIEALERKSDAEVSRLSHDLDRSEHNRQLALDAAANTIQTGLDKAERALQLALDKAERNLQIALEAAEKRVNERFDGLKETQNKADAALEKRLMAMNEFQTQINGERALYVTREQLDLMIKSIGVELKPLQASQAEYRGQARGSTVTRGMFAWGIGLSLTILTVVIMVASLLIHNP